MDEMKKCHCGLDADQMGNCTGCNQADAMCVCPAKEETPMADAAQMGDGAMGMPQAQDPMNAMPATPSGNQEVDGSAASTDVMPMAETGDEEADEEKPADSNPVM